MVVFTKHHNQEATMSDPTTTTYKGFTMTELADNLAGILADTFAEDDEAQDAFHDHPRTYATGAVLQNCPGLGDVRVKVVADLVLLAFEYCPIHDCDLEICADDNQAECERYYNGADLVVWVITPDIAPSDTFPAGSPGGAVTQAQLMEYLKDYAEAALNGDAGTLAEAIPHTWEGLVQDLNYWVNAQVEPVIDPQEG